MARSTIIRLTKQYSPAAAGSNETVSLWVIKKGWRIVGMAIRKLVLADTAATALINTDAGSGSLAISTAKTLNSGAVLDVVNANDGAAMNQDGGAMATGDGNIQVVYTANAATVKPIIRIGVEVIPLAEWI